MIRELSKRVTRKSDGKPHPILTISSTSGFVRQDSKYRRYMAGESVNNYILLYNGEFAYNKGNSKTYELGCIFPLSNFETGLVPHAEGRGSGCGCLAMQARARETACKNRSEALRRVFNSHHPATAIFENSWMDGSAESANLPVKTRKTTKSKKNPQ